jgi:hypothetical protein
VSVLARLAGFAAVLALAFGGAALAGARVDPRPGDAEHEPAADRSMGGMADGHGGEAMAGQPVRGLAVSDDGLTLELGRTTARRGERFRLDFRIADRRGRPVRHFDVEHTRRMHVIVVRRDMTGFQHLHPTQGPDGRWSVPVALGAAGDYRVFADFATAATPHTLAGDLAVDGAVRSRPLPAPAASTTVDGLRVTLAEGAARAGRESALAFRVTRHGAPVAVDDYLGAKGHLVALRRGDLAFLHVHPDERSLRFMATFPTAGRYRLFLQFKTGGRIHTAAFTQEVQR